MAPQQSDWIVEALQESRAGQVLPFEILSLIVGMTHGGMFLLSSSLLYSSRFFALAMTLSEAKVVRENLMAERVHNLMSAEAYGEEEEWHTSQSLFGGTFNMCEH